MDQETGVAVLALAVGRKDPTMEKIRGGLP